MKGIRDITAHTDSFFRGENIILSEGCERRVMILGARGHYREWDKAAAFRYGRGTSTERRVSTAHSTPPIMLGIGHDPAAEGSSPVPLLVPQRDDRNSQYRSCSAPRTICR